MGFIHPSAIIEEGAAIGHNVSIGAFCYIGADVRLDDDVILHSHVVVTGHTCIGRGTQIFPFASLGAVPQDLKYRGELTSLEVGCHNVIREHVTMNLGTQGGGGITRIGDHGLYMVGVHIGHDCQIGNHVILANNATVAGHVIIEDRAVLGGLCAVHQFCRIGYMAMIGGMSGVEYDILPFSLVMGNRASLRGLNLVGLQRAEDIERCHINELRALWKQIHDDQGQGLIEKLRASVKTESTNPLISRLALFLEIPSRRRYVVP